MLKPLLLLSTILNIINIHFVPNSVKGNVITPTINPKFSSTLHVDIRVMLTHYILDGQLVTNADINGLFASVYGDDPNSWWGKLNATVVVHPESNSTATIYSVNNGECASKSVNQSQIPSLMIPPSATFEGKTAVGSVLCEIWQVKDPYPQVYYTNVYVSKGNIYQIQTLYSTTAAIDAEINVYFQNHDFNIPDSSWFLKPQVCK